jgi:hypothetical protein
MNTLLELPVYLDWQEDINGAPCVDAIWLVREGMDDLDISAYLPVSFFDDASGMVEWELDKARSKAEDEYDAKCDDEYDRRKDARMEAEG